MIARFLAGGAPAVAGSPPAVAGSLTADFEAAAPVAFSEAPCASTPAVHAEPVEASANFLTERVPPGRAEAQAAAAANDTTGTLAKLTSILNSNLCHQEMMYKNNCAMSTG